MDNDNNANAYRSKIIDRRRGNQSRDSRGSEVVMSSLIDEDELVIVYDGTKLEPAAYRRKITGLWGGNQGRDSQIMGGLLDNNKLVFKDAKGEAEHSHWRQRQLVPL